MAKLRKNPKGKVPLMEEASNNLVAVENTSKQEKEELKPLNFKVPASFKKEYRQFALDNDLTLVALLKLSYETYKKLNQ